MHHNPPQKQFIIWITLLIFAAFFMRVANLDGTPPGVAFDVTWDLADSVRINQGVAFPAVFDTRPEPIHRFLMAGWLRLTGEHVFTALLMHGLAGTFTVALAYRAGLVLLQGKPYRYWGALIAAATFAAIVPHIFLSRVLYRVVFTPMVILIAFILLLRANRTRHIRTWAWGGFAAASGVHTYIAGIASLPWLIGYLIHQSIFQQGRKIGWRNAFALIVGAAIAIAPWLLLIYLVPGLFFRIGETVSEPRSLVQTIVEGLAGAGRAFFVDGYHIPLYNTPESPFVNPILAVLVIIGAIAALIRWRQADGALVLGGLAAFIIPAAFTVNPNHSTRLVGTMPFLALLAGWGFSQLAALISRKRENTLFVRRALTTVMILIAGISLAASHLAYQNMFTDPRRYDDPKDWHDIPHNYTTALFDALDILKDVDQPTYVPLELVNQPLSYFMLQRADYFPNVTTWARHGLTELPEGQIFYPALTYYHAPTFDSYPLQVLFLPDEDTIVILPELTIERPTGDDVEEIVSKDGTVIAHTAPRAASPLITPDLQPEPAPTIGEGLRLMNQPEGIITEADSTENILLYWAVDAPQPADDFSVVQLIDSEFNAIVGSDHHILPYLYPSACWQPGDIIPDLHQLRIPDDLSDGMYRLGTAVYVPPGQNPRPVSHPMIANPLETLWIWNAVQIGDRETIILPDDALEQDVYFGDSIQLIASRVDQQGDTWTFDLYWRTDSLPLDNYVLFLHVLREGELIAQSDAPPQPPTWSWIAGDVIHTQHQLTIEGEPDEIRLGFYNYPALIRLPVGNGDSFELWGK